MLKQSKQHLMFKSIEKGISNTSVTERITATLVFYDMLFLYKIWRHARGYPVNGQTTHTNASTAKKNKLLFKFWILNMRANKP